MIILYFFLLIFNKYTYWYYHVIKEKQEELTETISNRMERLVIVCSSFLLCIIAAMGLCISVNLFPKLKTIKSKSCNKETE